MNIDRYIDRITAAYKTAHPRYMELATRKDELINELAELPYNKLLSEDGKKSKRDTLNRGIAEATLNIKTLFDAINAEFQSVKAEHTDNAKKKLQEDFEAVDAKTIELINSGCLKLTELTELADHYNNSILSRLIAKAIITQYKGDIEAEQAASVLEHADNAQIMKEARAIDNAIQWAQLGVGGKLNQFIDNTGFEARYAASFDSNYDSIVAGIKDGVKEE